MIVSSYLLWRLIRNVRTHFPLRSSFSSHSPRSPRVSFDPSLCFRGSCSTLLTRYGLYVVDSDDPNPSSSAKQAKLTNQRERQSACLRISRQATTLLERTRLNVRIICQAIHAKVPRHMLVDMIDFHEPTLVVVGSRGLTKLKG